MNAPNPAWSIQCENGLYSPELGIESRPMAWCKVPEKNCFATYLPPPGLYRENKCFNFWDNLIDHKSKSDKVEQNKSTSLAFDGLHVCWHPCTNCFFIKFYQPWKCTKSLTKLARQAHNSLPTNTWKLNWAIQQCQEFFALWDSHSLNTNFVYPLLSQVVSTFCLNHTLTQGCELFKMDIFVLCLFLSHALAGQCCNKTHKYTYSWV